jgi:hypothetical protein
MNNSSQMYHLVCIFYLSLLPVIVIQCGNWKVIQVAMSQILFLGCPTSSKRSKCHNVAIWFSSNCEGGVFCYSGFWEDASVILILNTQHHRDANKIISWLQSFIVFSPSMCFLDNGINSRISIIINWAFTVILCPKTSYLYSFNSDMLAIRYCVNS